MRPLRRTLELLLANEDNEPTSAPPAARSSILASGLALGGGLGGDQGTRSLARFVSRRSRVGGAALPQAYPSQGRAGGEGGEVGAPQGLRAGWRGAGGSSSELTLLSRALSAEMISTVRGLRESGAGARGWPPPCSPARLARAACRSCRWCRSGAVAWLAT